MNTKSNLLDLSPDIIAECFKNKDHQADVLLDLYKLVIPDWDNIAKLVSWPSCNDKIWQFICQKFIEFDKYHHRDCIAGGAWMNSGFGIDNTLPDWTVEPIASDKIIYKWMKNSVIYVSDFSGIDEIWHNITINRLYRNDHHWHNVTNASYKRLHKLLAHVPVKYADTNDDSYRLTWMIN